MTLSTISRKATLTTVNSVSMPRYILYAAQAQLSTRPGFRSVLSERKLRSLLSRFLSGSYVITILLLLLFCHISFSDHFVRIVVTHSERIEILQTGNCSIIICPAPNFHVEPSSSAGLSQASSYVSIAENKQGILVSRTESGLADKLASAAWSLITTIRTVYRAVRSASLNCLEAKLIKSNWSRGWIYV